MDSYNSLNPKYNPKIKESLRNQKIYSSTDIAFRFQRFFRMGYMDVENAATGSKEYLFFTKPNLYLFKPGVTFSRTAPGKVSLDDLHPSIRKNSPLLCSMYNEAPYLFFLLTQRYIGHFNSCGTFIPLLTNTVSTNLDLPSSDAEYSELNKTQLGAVKYIRHNSYMSNNTFDFTLEFADNKFLEVYKLARIYDEYMNLKSSGLIDILNDPTDSGKGLDELMLQDMLDNIDTDSFSIYRIIVSDNGEDILHWSKLWGVTFSNVPRDAISNIGDDGKISIPLSFKAEHVEDLHPLIITDFNRAGGMHLESTRIKTPKSKIFDKESMQVNTAPTGTPFIVTRADDGNYFGGINNKPLYYKLKFKEL